MVKNHMKKRAPRKLIYSKMNKKGVSEVIGYILLVSFAIIMSIIIYQGLKTYVPVKAQECPDGVSILIKEALCTLNTDGTYNLSLTIKNNGRYNIAGYFIHATDGPNKTVATFPLIQNLSKGGLNSNVTDFNNAVLFEISTTENFVNISSLAQANYTGILKRIYSLDLLPIRFQKEENRLRMASCGKAMTREKITCA